MIEYFDLCLDSNLGYYFNFYGGYDCFKFFINFNFVEEVINMYDVFFICLEL